MKFEVVANPPSSRQMGAEDDRYLNVHHVSTTAGQGRLCVHPVWRSAALTGSGITHGREAAHGVPLFGVERKARSAPSWIEEGLLGW